LISLVCSKVDVQGLDAPWGTFIPGEYVVIYHENTTLEAATSHWGFVKKMGVEMIHTYTIGTTFKGFNAKISKDMLQTLQEDPMISEIHANAIAHTTQQKCHVRQDDAPSWGLTRVSHAGAVDGGMNNHYSHHEKGSGVNVYVLDTGVFVDHPDIRGRAVWGANFITGSGDNDRNGHGTHCAGTIAGSVFGVAKQARIVAVKVLGDSGSGSYGGIIAGIEWAFKHFQDHQGRGEKGVVSMSLGGGSDGGMQPAIAAAKAGGLPFVVAAGNSNADACRFYPAAFKECITVGATDAQDVRSYFSNFGTCVKIFAPGTGITSIWWDGSTNVLSGTSMACPHVAGEAAVLLSERNLSPDQLELELIASAQRDLIINPGASSPNLLLYNGCE
jgi:subtilisin family serine protease